MPPAVKTDLSADIAEGDGIALITTDELVKQSFALLKKGALEIRPGQAKQLALMRRLAPDFINRQLWKASKESWCQLAWRKAGKAEQGESEENARELQQRSHRITTSLNKLPVILPSGTVSNSSLALAAR